MNPSAAKVQCPFCLGHPRVKQDGTMYQHDRGARVKTLCPGAGKSKEEAIAARVLEKRQLAGEATIESGRQDPVDPEDIF